MVSENLKKIRVRIEAAAEKASRKAADIQLIAVSKTVDPGRINEAIEAGITIIGESRIQETQQKIEQIRPVECHLIGHLQTNKAKYAVRLYDMIQSVDSYRIAEEIDKQCEKEDVNIPVLLEVNTSGEESKFGCMPEQTAELADRISGLGHIRIKGLMTIGKFSDDPAQVRPCFVRLRNISQQIARLNLSGVSMDILSMGMSSDFEWAIEDGSTMVRIGSAIFGGRSYRQ
ncbi:MAG: YggS family pyridoxal phosphate-dependent enzyme [Calditrichia bacterium]